MMDHSHSFINGYLLIIFHVTGNVLGARNTIINEQWTLLLRVSKIIKSQDEKYIFVICSIFFKSEGLPSLETSRRQALTLECERFYLKDWGDFYKWRKTSQEVTEQSSTCLLPAAGWKAVGNLTLCENSFSSLAFGPSSEDSECKLWSSLSKCYAG